METKPETCRRGVKDSSEQNILVIYCIKRIQETSMVQISRFFGFDKPLAALLLWIHTKNLSRGIIDAKRCRLYPLPFKSIALEARRERGIIECDVSES